MNAPETVIVPGLVDDMPSAEYHSVDAIGSTSLKQLARSPAHCYGRCVDPGRAQIEATPAMKSGTLLHTVVLEPDQVEARYIVKPDGLDMRTKEGKAWVAMVPTNREVISVEQLEVAKAQRGSLLALPEVAALLAHGQAELSAFAIDAGTGLAIKARPDWTHPVNDGVILVDLKTCVDASPFGFQRAVTTFEYALQQAHYEAVVELAGMPVVSFLFAAVESTAPFVASAFVLSEDWAAYARRERRRLLELYRDCKASGEWPGYSTTVELLDMPKWLAREAEAWLAREAELLK